MIQSDDSGILQTNCCIVGGGPAGMVLGFLLARAGVEVLVLEKHADFLRDFRGDTIHPSTLQLMHELELLKDFLKRPHQEFSRIGALIDDYAVVVADFTHLPTFCKFIALMPQWDFLNFISEKAKRYPEFNLQMECTVTDLVIEGDRVGGVRANCKNGPVEIRAELVIGADGRHSITREKAGLPVLDLGAPIDVLWMRVSRQPHDALQTLGRFRRGKILVTLDRHDYWQCAYVIPKGAFAAVQEKGLQAFRDELETVAPFLRGRTAEIRDWNDVKLLTVAVDRLDSWSRPGLLCIGDAAHAMSPVGGVGINLAIQDAVATANILHSSLRTRSKVNETLDKVQGRRQFPTQITQAFQVFAHRRFITPAMASRNKITRLPLPLRLLQKFPVLRRVPARLVGLGVRPEHVRSPDAHS